MNTHYYSNRCTTQQLYLNQYNNLHISLRACIHIRQIVQNSYIVYIYIYMDKHVLFGINWLYINLTTRSIMNSCLI